MHGLYVYFGSGAPQSHSGDAYGWRGYCVHSGFMLQLRNQTHLGKKKKQYYNRLLADSSNFAQEVDIIFVISVRTNLPSILEGGSIATFQGFLLCKHAWK